MRVRISLLLKGTGPVPKSEILQQAVTITKAGPLTGLKSSALRQLGIYCKLVLSLPTSFRGFQIQRTGNTARSAVMANIAVW